jgi:hypothetical protein
VGVLGITGRRGVPLLALVAPDGQQWAYKPEAAEPLVEDATLVVMGGPEAVAELRRRFGGAAHPEAASAKAGGAAAS